MTFGALISATDPVTVLAIFHDLHVDPTLYSIVFGESGLNDATSIVLFSTMEKFKHSDEGISARSVFKSIFTFFVIFIGSICCGLAMGMMEFGLAMLAANLAFVPADALRSLSSPFVPLSTSPRSHPQVSQD
jgi:sodium/hydrogen exchanger-like protein 6/7